MRIKNLFVPVFILFTFFSSQILFAQEQWRLKRTPEERAKNQTEWMQNNLALTHEQNHKVYDIILYYAHEQDSIMNMPKGRDRKAEREGIEHDKEAELKTVLNEGQYQKYQAHVEEMKQRMQQRRNNMQQGEENGGY